MTDGFKIYVQRNPAWGRIQLYIVQRVNGKVYAAQPLDLVFKEIKEPDRAINPSATLQLDEVMGRELFQALAEALDKEGIKTPSQHNLVGQLDATKYHLEDLRELLKLKGGRQ